MLPTNDYAPEPQKSEGSKTWVPLSRIKAIVPYESTRIRKEVQNLRDAEQPGRLLDLAKRKAVKTVVILDDDSYVLCNVTSDTIINRIGEGEKS